MSIRLSERGVGNLLMLCLLLTFLNTAVSAFVIFIYLPSREYADRRMAEILRFNQEQWERDHIRIVPTKEKTK